jgi:NAD(P)-dependent dehydrogenase (short-subunit alcohol dehydrogenase family)
MTGSHLEKGMSAVATARFAGKVFAVTGGGSGIGEATVKKLSEGGASVVAADVDDVGGNRVTQEV